MKQNERKKQEKTETWLNVLDAQRMLLGFGTFRNSSSSRIRQRHVFGCMFVRWRERHVCVCVCNCVCVCVCVSLCVSLCVGYFCPLVPLLFNTEKAFYIQYSKSSEPSKRTVLFSSSPSPKPPPNTHSHVHRPSKEAGVRPKKK